MTMGRPPKPTHLKAVAGFPGKRKPTGEEPQPKGDLRTPPNALPEDQRVIWLYAIENSPPGLLRLLDRDLFGSWVSAVAELNTAEVKITETGGPVIARGGDIRTTTDGKGRNVTTTRSASLVRNPWCDVRDKAYLRMMKATSELGFSPTSRSRITLGGGKKDTNPFANHASRRRA